MDSQSTPHPSTPAPNAPVMDVRPPKPVETPVATEAPKDAPAQPVPAPAEPPETSPDTSSAPLPAAKTSAAAAPPRQPHTPGVGLAIAAAISIILGLAALFVYAYLRTNGISVL
ncbi:MAG TPA: hypothetical protein VHC98_03520 [Candidatus Saccharimonadales bacterium]|nr:hypothetical protein [Candidatus Saccharimonadales bacterium]